MNDQNKNALKSSVWYVASNILLKGAAFLTTPIFTRLMTQNEYGSFSNYLSWVTVLSVVITLNLEATLINARFDFKGKIEEFVLSMLVLSTVSASMWVIILNLGYTYFGSYISIGRLAMNIMLVQIMSSPAITILLALEKFQYQYKVNVILSMVLSLSVTGLSLLLVVIMKDKYMGRVLGSAVPYLILGVICYVYFIRKGKRVNFSYWKYGLKISLPYIPHLLALNILGNTDQTMITAICGADDTALYSLAYTVGIMVSLLVSSMNNAYAPWLGDRLHEKNHAEIRRFSYKYIGFFLALSAGLMLCAPEVLLVLGGSEYLSAKYVILPVILGCVCQFIYIMMVSVEQYEKKTVGMALASVGAALLNLVLNAIFIPKFGYMAAAWTTLASYGALMLLHMWLVYRIGLKSVYDYRFIAGILVAGGIWGGICWFLYGHTYVRYGVLLAYIIAFFVVIWKNRSWVLNLMKGKQS